MNTWIPKQGVVVVYVYVYDLIPKQEKSYSSTKIQIHKKLKSFFKRLDSIISTFKDLLIAKIKIVSLNVHWSLFPLLTTGRPIIYSMHIYASNA